MRRNKWFLAETIQKWRVARGFSMYIRNATLAERTSARARLAKTQAIVAIARADGRVHGFR